MSRRAAPAADEKLPCDIAAGLGKSTHSPAPRGENNCFILQ